MWSFYPGAYGQFQLGFGLARPRAFWAVQLAAGNHIEAHQAAMKAACMRAVLGASF